MKKVLIFIAVIVGFSLVLGTILQMLPAMPILASGFFKSIEIQQPEQGYGFFSNEYRQEISLEQYQSWLQVTNLDQYQSVRWAGKGTMSKGKGQLAGVVITKNGESFPVMFHFVQDENDHWWIQAIELKPRY